MADNYGLFWNSRGGDRLYSADSMEEWLKPFFVTGVFMGNFSVTPTSGMGISVSNGYCNINGKVRFFDDATTFTLDAATSARTDTVVIERNDANREITLKVVKGNSTTPTLPVREGGVYQLVLAQISIANGATSISANDITDTRASSSLCGYVTATIDDYDIETIYEIYKDKFEDWFEHLQDELDSNQAAHLQHEIDDLNAEVNDISPKIDALSQDYKQIDYISLNDVLSYFYNSSPSVNDANAKIEPFFDGDYLYFIACNPNVAVGSVISNLSTIWLTVYKYDVVNKVTTKIRDITCKNLYDLFTRPFAQEFSFYTPFRTYVYNNKLYCIINPTCGTYFNRASTTYSALIIFSIDLSDGALSKVKQSTVYSDTGSTGNWRIYYTFLNNVYFYRHYIIAPVWQEYANGSSSSYRGSILHLYAYSLNDNYTDVLLYESGVVTGLSQISNLPCGDLYENNYYEGTPTKCFIFDSLTTIKGELALTDDAITMVTYDTSIPVNKVTFFNVGSWYGSSNNVSSYYSQYSYKTIGVDNELYQILPVDERSGSASSLIDDISSRVLAIYKKFNGTYDLIRSETLSYQNCKQAELPIYIDAFVNVHNQLCIISLGTYTGTNVAPNGIKIYSKGGIINEQN